MQSFDKFWSLKSPFMGCPIKNGCEEFIFIINFETRLDLGKKKLQVYDFQVRLSVAAFLAFLVLNFWKCGKMWPSISKWTYTCQKNLKIQVLKYSAFDLAFLTFVGLFKILLRSLRCKKSGGMQESCTLAIYHQKQFSLKISHFESVWFCDLE